MRSCGGCLHSRNHYRNCCQRRSWPAGSPQSGIGSEELRRHTETILHWQNVHATEAAARVNAQLPPTREEVTQLLEASRSRLLDSLSTWQRELSDNVRVCLRKLHRLDGQYFAPASAAELTIGAGDARKRYLKPSLRPYLDDSGEIIDRVAFDEAVLFMKSGEECA
jgi:hypothetical protein